MSCGKSLERNSKQSHLSRSQFQEVNCTHQVWNNTSTWKDTPHQQLSDQCQSKLQWGITTHWSQRPSLKSSIKNKYCRGCAEKGILLQSWWECKWWTTVENSMGVPRNTKQSSIIWPCNPTPRLRSAEIHHSKWHVPLDFQSSTIYNSWDIESTKTSTEEKWRLRDTTIQLNTTQP